jgi:hypothetical protein
MQIHTKLPSPKPTKVYDTYWRFAAERQEIFFRRFRDEPPPWTTDAILIAHKFTNAYRASDRVSQYLIREVLYRGDQAPEETFFRCLLFKIFNRISTWECIEAAVGEIRFASYSFKRYDAILEEARQRGERIFSAAYIMPSRAAGLTESSKHRNFLALLERMMADGIPSRMLKLGSMADAFALLLGYPLIGNFLAYQLATDINYSTLTNFSENEFVMPGPGAKDGIRKCFETTAGLSEADVIRLVADRQEVEFFRLGLKFRSLWGRRLQLIDCQNLFCEVDKYARIAHPDVRGISGRSRIKQIFTANPQVVHYWFPPKWGINDRVEEACRDAALHRNRQTRGSGFGQQMLL